MRKILIIATITLLCFNYPLSARKVTIDDARIAGKKYFYERINQYHDVPYLSLIITSEFVEKQENEPVYYVFNFNDKGFVIVAADDIVYPILGYSFESSYSNLDQPENFRLWMKGDARWTL